MVCGGHFRSREFGTAEFAIPVDRGRSCLDLLLVPGTRIIVVLFVKWLGSGLTGKEWFIFREGRRQGRYRRGSRYWSYASLGVLRRPLLRRLLRVALVLRNGLSRKQDGLISRGRSKGLRSA
jgi:hypothetical protein